MGRRMPWSPAIWISVRMNGIHTIWLEAWKCWSGASERLMLISAYIQKQRWLPKAKDIVKERIVVLQRNHLESLFPHYPPLGKDVGVTLTVKVRGERDSSEIVTQTFIAFCMDAYCCPPYMDSSLGVLTVWLKSHGITSERFDLNQG